MAMFVALTMTMGFAYAEKVEFPILTDDGLIDYQLDTFYPTNSTYIIQISLLYQVDHPIEIPTIVTWFEIDGTSHNIDLQEDFRLIHFPVEEEETISPNSGLTEADIDKIIQDKHDELALEDDSGFSKLRACLVEFEEQEPVRYQAWNRIANLEEFIIPDEWLNKDHYSRAELEAQKKWVVCEALKKYKYVGAWEANKIIDVHEEQPLDMTDSPDTVDVTVEAIESEQIRAETFQCSEAGKSRGLCLDYMAGEKYVPTFNRVPDWYNEYREQMAQPVDLQVALDEAMLTQCDNYFQLYNQTDAIEVPSWLEHCK